MKNILLLGAFLALTLGCSTEAKAQVDVIKAENSDIELIIKDKRIHLSRGSISCGHEFVDFNWTERSRLTLNLITGEGSRRIIKRIRKSEYTWLQYGEKFYKFNLKDMRHESK